MGAWVIGHNLAGYLPESDTYAYETWDEAWRALRDEMEAYADSDDEGALAMLPTDPTEAESHGYTVTREPCTCGCNTMNVFIDYGDDEPSMRATVDSILADDGPDSYPDGDWSAHVTDGAGRSIVFWLAWSDDRSADEEDGAA